MARAGSWASQYLGEDGGAPHAIAIYTDIGNYLHFLYYFQSGHYIVLLSDEQSSRLGYEKTV